jgi:hypothetical protein
MTRPLMADLVTDHGDDDDKFLRQNCTENHNIFYLQPKVFPKIVPSIR